MNRFWRVLFWCAILLVVGEFALRLGFGFCDAVLMQENSRYEYIAQPDQTHCRFGNRIVYNHWSMRCDAIDTNAARILVFGDSVVNGGMLTDQDSLATSRLTAYFSSHGNHKVQFLNISAGSWGPDNAFAYLDSHGDFGASGILLVCSSHDAHDNMQFEKLVGINESFPDHQYHLAWTELIERYAWPAFRAYVSSAARADESASGINKNDPTFNSGFGSFSRYAAGKKLPLAVYLHAETSEVRNGAYNAQGREILEFAAQNNIQVIRELDQPFAPADYRDNIHPTESGQRKMFELLEERLPALLPLN